MARTPLLSGRLGAAFVRGLQGPDLAHPKTIATPKHLAVHSGPEGGRDSFSVQVAPRDLEETYLPAFRIAVTEGRALSLMCAYNGLHGTPVCALPSLMIDRLRRDWGFTGLTVSDCDAIGNIWLFQHAARDPAHAAAMALKGGTDLNCGTAYAALPEAVRAGLVDEATVDVALARAVKVRRLLSAPSAWDRIAPSAVGAPAHRALALEAAEKSIVLLKNDAKLLPLSARRIAVIGANADDLGVIEGNYHGTAIRPVTPLAGIRARFPGTTYAQGSLLAEGSPVVLPETALSEGGKPGLAVHITDAAGKASTRRDRTIDLNLTRAARVSWRLDGRVHAAGAGRLSPDAGRRGVLARLPAARRDPAVDRRRTAYRRCDRRSPAGNRGARRCAGADPDRDRPQGRRRGSAPAMAAPRRAPAGGGRARRAGCRRDRRGRRPVARSGG